MAFKLQDLEGNADELVTDCAFDMAKLSRKKKLLRR
jgi:hypothetical protein